MLELRRTQVETALKLLEPHRYCGEILQGLAAVQPEGSISHLLPTLRETPWLIAEATPITPADVLALPSNVDEAAGVDTLLTEGKTLAFSTAQKLTIDIRNSNGFEKLRHSNSPTVAQSVEALTLMIEEQGIVGRLGRAGWTFLSTTSRYSPDRVLTCGCAAGRY